MFNLINRLLGRHQNKLVVRFHTDANGMTEHGTFYADHKGLGLSNYPVRFAFEGLTTPPRLDRFLFNYVMDKAEGEGYVVLGMRSYFGMVQSTASKVTTQQVREHVATTPNKRALELHYATERAKNTGEPQIIHDGQLLVKPDGAAISAPPQSQYVKLPSGEVSLLTGAHGHCGPITVDAGVAGIAPKVVDLDVLDMSGMVGSTTSVPYLGNGVGYDEFKRASA